MNTNVDGITLATGSSSGALIGYVAASYDELCALFGLPNGGQSADGKVTTEWVLKFENSVFSIYDYKATDRYARHLPSVEKFRKQPSYEWHIGGHDRWPMFGSRVEEALATLRARCDNAEIDDESGSRRILAIIRAGVFGGKMPFKPGAKINQDIIALIQEISTAVLKGKKEEEEKKKEEKAVEDPLSGISKKLDTIITLLSKEKP